MLVKIIDFGSLADRGETCAGAALYSHSYKQRYLYMLSRGQSMNEDAKDVFNLFTGGSFISPDLEHANPDLYALGVTLALIIINGGLKDDKYVTVNLWNNVYTSSTNAYDDFLRDFQIQQIQHDGGKYRKDSRKSNKTIHKVPNTNRKHGSYNERLPSTQRKTKLHKKV